MSSFPVGQCSQNSTLHVESSCQPSSLPFHHTHRSTALRRGKKGDLQSPSLCPHPREQLLLPKATLGLHMSTTAKGDNFFLCGRIVLKISNITHSPTSMMNIEGTSWRKHFTPLACRDICYSPTQSSAAGNECITFLSSSQNTSPVPWGTQVSLDL